MGEGAKFHPPLKQAGSSPVYPQKTLWSGGKNFLSRVLPPSGPNQLSVSLKALPSPSGPNWLV